MLRMISFGLDYHWHPVEAAKSTSDSVPTDSIPLDYRGRVKTPVSREQYTFVNYLAYCLYPPLYTAGPIITFNDFTWQVCSYCSPPLDIQDSHVSSFVTR